MKRIIILLICTATFFIGLMSIYGREDTDYYRLKNELKGMNQKELSENVLRLHVIANSNSKIDQDVKLKVKDELVKRYTQMLPKNQTKESAIKFTREHLSELCDISNSVLSENGMSYGASTRIARVYFPDKTYDSAVFPKGEYDAVQVLLGEGRGENWWCVLYPPLCFINVREDKNVSSVSINQGNTKDNADNCNINVGSSNDSRANKDNEDRGKSENIEVRSFFLELFGE